LGPPAFGQNSQVAFVKQLAAGFHLARLSENALFATILIIDFNINLYGENAITKLCRRQAFLSVLIGAIQ